jgi:hypothetical protein
MQTQSPESGVLAFRREHNGEPMVFLISKVGYPEGARRATSQPARERTKEAVEEAGVIRAAKTTANPGRKQVI